MQSNIPIILPLERTADCRSYCVANEEEVHHDRDNRTHGTQRSVDRHGYCHCRIDYEFVLNYATTQRASLRSPQGRLAGRFFNIAAGRTLFRRHCTH